MVFGISITYSSQINHMFLSYENAYIVYTKQHYVVICIQENLICYWYGWSYKTLSLSFCVTDLIFQLNLHMILLWSVSSSSYTILKGLCELRLFPEYFRVAYACPNTRDLTLTDVTHNLDIISETWWYFIHVHLLM